MSTIVSLMCNISEWSMNEAVWLMQTQWMEVRQHSFCVATRRPLTYREPLRNCYCGYVSNWASLMMIPEHSKGEAAMFLVWLWITANAEFGVGPFFKIQPSQRKFLPHPSNASSPLGKLKHYLIIGLWSPDHELSKGENHESLRCTIPEIFGSEQSASRQRALARVY